MANSNEQAWAAAWASSLANSNLSASAAQTSSATPSKKSAQAGGDLVSAIALLAKLADQQHQSSAENGADAPLEPHAAQALPQRFPQSAFLPFNNHPVQRLYGHQSHEQQQQHTQQADADAEQTSHLEAVSFWLQLFQVAHSGLKSALQQAEASLPSLPTMLAALTGAQNDARSARNTTSQQASHLAQLRALLNTSAPAVAAIPQQELLSQQLLRPQPASAVAALQQQSPQHQQNLYAERSLDREQPLSAVGAERSLDRFKPHGSFGPDRSLDRTQQQPNQQGFFAERSMDRATPQHLLAERGKDRYILHQAGFPFERSLDRGVADPDSVVGFGKDWSLDPSDQSQDHLRKRARRVDDGRLCSNCGTTNTPFWRKDRHSGLALCNACGLYAAKNDHPRPVKLWGPGMPPLGVTTINAQGMSRLGHGGMDGPGTGPPSLAPGSSPGSAHGPGPPPLATAPGNLAAAQQYATTALQGIAANLRQSHAPPSEVELSANHRAQVPLAQGEPQQAQHAQHGQAQQAGQAESPPVAAHVQAGVGGGMEGGARPGGSPMQLVSPKAPQAQTTASQHAQAPSEDVAPPSRNGSHSDVRSDQAGRAQHAQQATPPAASTAQAGASPSGGAAALPAEGPATADVAAQQVGSAQQVAATGARSMAGQQALPAQQGRQAQQEQQAPLAEHAGMVEGEQPSLEAVDASELQDAKALQSAAEALVAAFDAAAGRAQPQGKVQG